MATDWFGREWRDSNDYLRGTWWVERDGGHECPMGDYDADALTVADVVDVLERGYPDVERLVVYDAAGVSWSTDYGRMRRAGLLGAEADPLARAAVAALAVAA